ncbi:hypothetical protein [Fervidobacterium sp.]
MSNSPSYDVLRFVVRIIIYSLVVSSVILLLGVLLRRFSFVLGVLIGDVGVIIGLISSVTTKDRFIKFGKGYFRTGYFLRYVLYASLFLLASFILKNPTEGILGVFAGLMSLKIVVFLFAWRWKP